MGFREDPGCQKEKSSAENGDGLVHNAGATKKDRKKHNLTTYVNNCNYSTPDIVEDRQKKPIYCEWVDIKYAI